MVRIRHSTIITCSVYKKTIHLVSNESNILGHSSVVILGGSFVCAGALCRPGNRYALVIDIHDGVLQSDVVWYKVEMIS